MSDPYSGREQTKAKHFILRRYLQALAFKVLHFSKITYVDGFSGPWMTKTEDFRDSSFMIAIEVLMDAQAKMQKRTSVNPQIRCFFSESDPQAFAQLQAAVARYDKPANGFEIKTYFGKFEDAVGEIQSFIGTSFPLIFIDPTGWTGYPFAKIKQLFARPKAEVLINFMYDHINRFANSDDPEIIVSLEPILGGPGWRERIDTNLPRGLAVEKLFRETLKTVGNFDYVISTKIDRERAERPHFFITYGTKSRNGLKTFREIEYSALRGHVMTRASAKEKRREEKSGSPDLFPNYYAQAQEIDFDEMVTQQKERVRSDLLELLSQELQVYFRDVVDIMLQAYMLRETNVKDVCVELAREGKIENTWRGGNRKPKDYHLIRLRESGS